MKSYLYVAAALLFTSCSEQQTTNRKDASTNALFARTFSESGESIYDTRAWAFYSGGPVRATPLLADSSIYFGNTAGTFFAIDQSSGKIAWQYQTGFAINSSAARNAGKIFFADNKQSVYALDEKNGKLIWKTDMGAKENYPWRFDYFYSSPTLFDNSLLIGSDDGFLHMLGQNDGQEVWKFKSKGMIRSSAIVVDNMAVVGDVQGTLYAVDVKNGKELWRYSSLGDSLDNEKFGFDRKAILASPVVAGDKIIVGCRDGLLYCINLHGQLQWKMDHHVSWIVSTVAIKDSLVVTGTSDGRFVQAVNINNGKQIWRTQTATLFWSSPLIVNNHVYIGGFDGNEYCLDLHTGQPVSRFQTAGIVLSSAVYNNHHIYFGSDDGNLYALSGHADRRMSNENKKRLVFYEQGVNIHFRSGSDARLKDYLVHSGFQMVNTDSLQAFLSRNPGSNSVIVFASDYFPGAVTRNGPNSLIRKYLEHGGRVVLTGINPLVYQLDQDKQPMGFNVPAADTVLGIKYGNNDTRSFGGQFSSFATEKGKEFGLPDFWISNLQIDEKQVDVVFGKNENGYATSFAKKYANGGILIQSWFDTDVPHHLDALLKLSEWKID